MAMTMRAVLTELDRINGQMVDDMTPGRDDVSTARDLLSLLYAQLVDVAGAPLTLAAVQHARDTLAWELRPVASSLLPAPWADVVVRHRVHQRTPRNWPVPASAVAS